jgi:TPR repeat protein
MKRFSPALVVLMLLLTACDSTPDFDRGLTAYNRGDYATALGEWQPLAEQGNAAAQSGLGAMYYGGQGVPRDERQAANWYRKAADQGQREAQFRLAVMYDRGIGVPPNYAEAARWYHAAAERGHAEAQYRIGLLFLSGIGVPKNLVLAHMWFDRAAAQGHSEAARSRGAVATIMTPDQIAEAQRLAGAR